MTTLAEEGSSSPPSAGTTTADKDGDTPPTPHIQLADQTTQAHDHQHRPGLLGIGLHDPHDFRRSSLRRLSDRRRSSDRRRKSSLVLERVPTKRQWWKFTFRDWDDDEEQDWWFASTAIPLLAATIGPLANVFSLAALVTSWRMCLVTGVDRTKAHECAWNGDKNSLGPELTGRSFADPHWCLYLNIASLVVGFVGNFFLLCNFTRRIRYIVALPVTIVMWYVATGLLIGITVSMQVYVPPVRPQQTYTQGFWYAVSAAAMYMVCSMLLMVNMLGYFLGHYPQHFQLTESQRTLILQTMLFFLWLAGGGAVFSKIESLYGDGQFEWNYVNSLYFCDVTILTVGFGDLYPTSNVARGMVFPFSVGGIIMLGLMVSSITRFAAELGSENIVRRHVEHSRSRTVGRTVTMSQDLEHRRSFREAGTANMSISRTTKIDFADNHTNQTNQPPTNAPMAALQKVTILVKRPKKPKLLLLREEKDRFDAMRSIQKNTSRFKNWYALCLSVTAFGILWCVGAIVFWICERHTQEMTYFKALYFCYVSLLTIGYGDLAPISNAGRPFFVLWSVIAVPTMTILVSDLGETVINKFTSGTARLGDFTVLPQKGVWRQWLNRHEGLLRWLQQRKERREEQKRLEEGFQIGPDPEAIENTITIDQLATGEPPDQDLAKRLTKVMRRVAKDAKDNPKKRYSYEEWVEFTQLIRFTAVSREERVLEDEEEGMIDWDWIGEDSPMMAKQSEADFVLDRLCESMNRLVKRFVNCLPPDGDFSGTKELVSKRRPRQLNEDDFAPGYGVSGAAEKTPIADDEDEDLDDLGPKNESRLGKED